MKHLLLGIIGGTDADRAELVTALNGKPVKNGGNASVLRLADGSLLSVLESPQSLGFADLILCAVPANQGFPEEFTVQLSALKLEQTVFALTQMDAASKEVTDTLEASLRKGLGGTLAKDTPMFRVSAKTGKGLDALKRGLLSVASRTEEKSSSLPFRVLFERGATKDDVGELCLDAVLLSGTLRLGDVGEFFGRGETATVKRIAFGGETVTEAVAGLRVTLTLTDFSGETLTNSAEFAPPGFLERLKATPSALEMKLLYAPNGRLFTEASPELETEISNLIASGHAVRFPDDRLFSHVWLALHHARLVSQLKRFHAKNLQKVGATREELRRLATPQVDAAHFGALLGYFHNLGVLVSEGETARLPDFKRQLSGKQSALLQRVRDFLKICGVTAPPPAIIADELHVSEDAVTATLQLGIEQNLLVSANEGAVYARETVETIKRIVEEIAAADGKISVSAFRERAETNRKFAVIALELMDSLGVTERVGDARKLV